MKIIYELEKQHIIQLHKLYQKEWWTKERTLEETQKVVENSQIVIAMVDESNKLQAFVRVLTDYVFKSLVFDLIVSEKYRSKGLGKELMYLVQNHLELQDVKHFELYCLPEMLEFYEELGFSSELDNLVFMRKGEICMQ
jgi:ribosomal protein S18 acetylase RimI-like enzyme